MMKKIINNQNVLVIGTGVFASALINNLLKNNHNVYCYGVDNNQINSFKNQISSINNQKFIKKINIVSNDFNSFANINIKYVVLAIPSGFIKTTVDNVLKHFKNVVFINVSKGKIEINKTVKLVTLIGPSFANELFDFKITSFDLIGNDIKILNEVKSMFSSSNIIIKTILNDNKVIEFSIWKNIMAIGMGIVYTLTDSINTRAYYFTTFLNEISEITKANNLISYCGIGDIYLTCLHPNSRNFTFGSNIAKNNLSYALKENKNITVEGYSNCKSMEKTILKNKNKCPLFYKIYLVLFKNEDAKIFLKL